MPQLENDIARLKSLSYLLSEALRIAGEGARQTIVAKIEECVAHVGHELEAASDELRRRQSDGSPGQRTAPTGSAE